MEINIFLKENIEKVSITLNSEDKCLGILFVASKKGSLLVNN